MAVCESFFSVLKIILHENFSKCSNPTAENRFSLLIGPSSGTV
jgi:hypothetical protein